MTRPMAGCAVSSENLIRSTCRPILSYERQPSTTSELNGRLRRLPISQLWCVWMHRPRRVRPAEDLLRWKDRSRLCVVLELSTVSSTDTRMRLWMEAFGGPAAHRRSVPNDYNDWFMRRTKRSNLRTYAFWSPFYDRLIGLAPFRRGRAKAHQRLALKAGERVLLVGVGTGIDLPLLPVGVEAVGVDLSPLMLARARNRLPIKGRQIELLEADAQAMPLADSTFDAALLSLVLSVVPDGATCLAETLRLLKPDSRAVVFDKFLPKGKRPTFGRRVLNLLTNLFGTDINRTFEPMVETCGVEIITDEPAALGGAYRVIVLRKV